MIIKSGIIPRVAFSLFGMDIYWYAILITSAIVIGYIWVKVHDGRFNIKYDDVFNLSLFMLPSAFICARLYYVAFNLSYYLQYPGEILNVRNGGLAIYGGVIGAVISILVFCKIKKINFLDLMDYLAPVLPLGQAIGRWGNYINVEAYGTETNLPLKMEVVENGVTKYVHPTFLYESVGNLIVFTIVVIASRKKKFKGQIAYIYLMGYSLVRFFVEGIRTDSLMLGSLRISQVLSLVIFVVALILYIVSFCRTKNG